MGQYQRRLVLNFNDYVLAASNMAEAFGADDLNVKASQRLDETGVLCRWAIGRWCKKLYAASFCSIRRPRLTARSSTISAHSSSVT